MSTADLIKIGASVVIFILCLVGNIHFKGVIKNFSNEVDKKTIKKKNLQAGRVHFLFPNAYTV